MNILTGIIYVENVFQSLNSVFKISELIISYPTISSRSNTWRFLLSYIKNNIISLNLIIVAKLNALPSTKIIQ